MKTTSLFSTGLLAAGAIATNQITPDKVEKDVREDKLQNVLWNLNKIARDNGGNRAFGFPGYNASMDFILERMVTRFGKHFDTTIQPFTHLFATTYELSVTGPNGEVDAVTLQYNNPTPAGGVTANLVNVPIDDEQGSGCFEEQWDGLDVDGKIALVKRGVCPIADKLRFAKDNGAVGAILIHNIAGPEIGDATLSAENYGLIAPVGVVTLEQGTEWFEAVEAGEDVEITLLVDAIAEDRETWNIISETKAGDPNNVVMLGAHLDSVQRAPGVNDDGSGSAALLELAGSLKSYSGLKNKVRFAWWGAEESGLVGSRYYVGQLSEEEADKTRFYFNYDMIGSLNPFFHVYADDDDDKTGGKFLYDYLTEQGFPAEYVPFGTSSDYVAFIEAGIPSSGLFTGAGAPQDACYHIECDDINNINWEAITANAKAAGRAITELALDLSEVPPRDKSSLNPSSKRGVARNIARWNNIAKGLEKHHSCGGDKKNTV